MDAHEDAHHSTLTQENAEEGHSDEPAEEGEELDLLESVPDHGEGIDPNHEHPHADGEHDHSHDGVAHADAEQGHDDHSEAAAAGGHGAEAHGDDHGGGHEVTWMSRVWANLLMNSYYFFLFSIGALFFLAVNHLANAGWATMLKRIMEAVSSYMYIGFILLFAVVVFGRHEIYHWVNYFDAAETGDRILDSKHWLLNNSMLLFGIPIMVGVWLFIRTKLRNNSRKEDSEGGLSFFRSSNKWSAGYIFFFAFSFSALTWLLIMSIDAHWYSTMFSVFNFATMFVTSLSVMMMFLLYLKSKGYMEMVSDEVVHDLGKFMFAFCVFWGYIFVGQWLLIWYANLPEETVYFDARLTEYYKPLFFSVIFMCFVLPFLILMMRNAKRNPKVLILAGSIILIGHWISCYLMVMPGILQGATTSIGLLEIGTTMAFAGIFIYTVLNAFSKANLYAVNHPYILESANHDVGP
jgi:hypothetical protein